MDRRYYGLKALVIGIAFSVAVLGGGLECSRLAMTHNPNYQAAFLAQSAVREASVNFSHTLGRFFSHAFAFL